MTKIRIPLMWIVIGSKRPAGMFSWISTRDFFNPNTFPAHHLIIRTTPDYDPIWMKPEETYPYWF